MNYLPYNKAILPVAIMLLGLSQASITHAAQQAFALEEIIVTAQKREQSLQDVGIAISAFDGETLEAMGVTTSNEIAAKTPNLNIVSPVGEGGVVSVFIRGVGLNDFALNNTGPVGFYVDDSSIGSSNGQLTTLFDIARVEVLKGPQGTLFGRNTTGGALNIVSNKPTEEFEATIKSTIANYGYLKTEGVVSGALFDSLNGRLALVANQSDGYMENLSNGDSVEKQNFAGRLLLDYHPSDDLSVLFNLHGSRNDSDSDLYGNSNDEDFYKGSYGDEEFRINVDTRGASAKVSYDLSDTITLTSITAYDGLEKRQQEEADMSPLHLLGFEYNAATHTFSQELRLNGVGDHLQWIAGAYHLSESINWNTVSDNSDLEIIENTGITLGLSNSVGHQQLTTSALFGQLEFDLSEQWALTVGGRYSKVDVDFDYEVDIPAFQPFSALGIASNVAFVDTLSNEEFSGKLALTYAHTEDRMFYGSVTRGFKGGGFNGGLISDLANYSATAEYQPEFLTAYELGMKSSLLDGTMRLNTALFYYDYDDAQVYNNNSDPVTGLPQNMVQNAESLQIYGLEVDLSWQPVEALFVQLGLGYTHSEFDSFDLNVPSSTGVSGVDLSGETPQNSPSVSATLLANYEWSLDGKGSLSLQLDGSYQSEILYSNGIVLTAGEPSSYSRNEELGQAGHSIWNSRLAWSDNQQQLELALWVKNLGDKAYATYMAEQTDLNGYDALLRGTPRTFGMDVKYAF